MVFTRLKVSPVLEVKNQISSSYVSKVSLRQSVERETPCLSSYKAEVGAKPAVQSNELGPVTLKSVTGPIFLIILSASKLHSPTSAFSDS